ncbi:hypothetical protein ACS0TY_024075 [Phlomoides rotata]
MDKDYMDRFDRILLEGEMVDEDAKIIGVVGGLTLGTKLWKDMNRHWPKTYAEFRERSRVIMSITEPLTREMGEKKEDKPTQAENKKWLNKKAGAASIRLPITSKPSRRMRRSKRT